MGKTKIIDRDLGWKAMQDALKEIKDSHVKVGILADENKGGLHIPGGQLTVAEYAAVNEFGTEDQRIPSRSFLRSTFAEQRDALADLGKRLIADVLAGERTTKDALELMGLTLATAVKRKITDGPGIPPPNRPSTARAKQAKGEGAIRTLVDTGRLLASITWSVVIGKR